MNTLFEFLDSQPLNLSYPHQGYSVNVSQVAFLRKGENGSILVFVRPCGFMLEESSGGRDEVAWRAASRTYCRVQIS